MRLLLAFKCFFRVLFGKPLPDELAPKQLPPPERVVERVVEREKIVEKAADPSAGALLLLGMLQREGRLVDFLRESIDGYDDAAIGAAVRDIHRGCKKVLSDHFHVEPVVPGQENDAFIVEPGFDPGRIRLMGSVAGQPPFKGVLRHHGWRAARVTLPAAGGIDPAIVAPAEVEL